MTLAAINWNDLIQDVAGEVRKGTTADIAIDVVAQDYGVSADTLRTRFERAYPEGVPAPLDNAVLIERQIVATCRRYGVPRSACIGPIVTKQNRKVTVVCRTNSGYIAVCMATGSVRALRYGSITHASMAFAGLAA